MKRLSFILLITLLCWAGLSAKPVTGSVRSEGKALSGVVVTDGYNFALTDNKGNFRLELSAEAKFVHVVTPAGYTAPFDTGTPLFYIEVEAKRRKYDFDLLPYGNQSDYGLIAIADPQTQNDRHFGRFEKESIPDIAEQARTLTEEGIAPVGICLGDIAWDVLSFFDNYKKAVYTLGIPFYPVIGNHDYDLTLKGDDATGRQYNDNFGPEYYAFNLGKDYVIVLDNIIYDTNKQYKTELDAKQLAWVEKYLQFVPKGSQVLLAMHAPVLYYFKPGAPKMKTAEQLLAMLSDYRPRFMTGHTHISGNHEVAPGVMEHNVASIGGSWWTARVSKDGTPCGYQVFTSRAGDFSWFYKSVGKPESYQFKAYDKGTFPTKPNAVVAKVWNWDPAWKVEWYADGKPMGAMEQFTALDPDYMRYLQKRRNDGKPEVGGYKWPVPAIFYFAAEPSIYTKEVRIVATDGLGNRYEQVVRPSSIDVQAHRGGIGLMPENTIEAMIAAVELGVNTLELDLNISGDRKVVVSHDPYMNYKFVLRPDGSQIDKARTREYALYRMTYDSIRMYNTGIKPHPDYPGQKKLDTYKPLVSDLIDAVEKFTSDKGYSKMYYNIEIKSSPERDGVYSPEYREFTDLVMEVLLSKNLGERLLIQSFDVRTLQYLHEKYPDVRLSYLVDRKQGDFEANMELLGFVPECYSPHHTLVNEESLRQFHQMGLTVVPWTVDKPEDIKRMIDLGVDAIISNYPDRVLSQTRRY